MSCLCFFYYIFSLSNTPSNKLKDINSKIKSYITETNYEDYKISDKGYTTNFYSASSFEILLDKIDIKYESYEVITSNGEINNKELEFNNSVDNLFLYANKIDDLFYIKYIGILEKNSNIDNIVYIDVVNNEVVSLIGDNFIDDMQFSNTFASKVDYDFMQEGLLDDDKKLNYYNFTKFYTTTKLVSNLNYGSYIKSVDVTLNLEYENDYQINLYGYNDRAVLGELKYDKDTNIIAFDYDELGYDHILKRATLIKENIKDKAIFDEGYEYFVFEIKYLSTSHGYDHGNYLLNFEVEYLDISLDNNVNFELYTENPIVNSTPSIPHYYVPFHKLGTLKEQNGYTSTYVSKTVLPIYLYSDKIFKLEQYEIHVFGYDRTINSLVEIEKSFLNPFCLELDFNENIAFYNINISVNETTKNYENIVIARSYSE